MATKQRDGRYRTRVTVGRDALGNAIVKYVSGRTKKELAANRDELLRRYATGAEARRDILAEDFLRTYYSAECAPHRKAATQRDQLSQIARFVLPTLAGRQLRAITAFDLARVMTGCADRCATIVSFIRGFLRGAFASAYAQGIIDRDPAAALTAKPRAKATRRALTDAERSAIEALIAERGESALLAGLLYYTGLRRGEALGLQWRDVDLRGGVIRVERDVDYKIGGVDGLKTPAARREVPVCPELHALLSEYRGVGSAYVLHGADPSHWMHESTFRRRWGAIRERVGSELTPHYLRHNYATVLYDAGVDVLAAARILGHSDPAVTMRIYVEISRLRRVRDGMQTARSAFDLEHKKPTATE